MHVFGLWAKPGVTIGTQSRHEEDMLTHSWNQGYEILSDKLLRRM